MSCLFIRVSAEPGLSSFSAASFGLAAAFVVAFLALGFGGAFSDPDLEVERLRDGFLGGASPLGAAVSLRGTLVTVILG